MVKSILLATSIAALLSTSALASDLPTKGPLITKGPLLTKGPVQEYAVPTFVWSGFYAGVEGGYDLLKTTVSTATSTGVSGSGSSSGNGAGLLGGVLGYNYQFGHYVVGAEGNLDAILGANKSFTNTYGGNNFDLTSKSTYVGDVRGRLGYAYDRALFFVDGGVAVGDVKASAADTTVGFGAQSTSKTRVGYTLGAGVDYAITNDWVGRVDYRYTDLGNKSTNFTGPGITSVGAKSTSNAFLIGALYRFDIR